MILDSRQVVSFFSILELYYVCSGFLDGLEASGYGGAGMKFFCFLITCVYLDRYELMAYLGLVLSYRGDIGAWLNQYFVFFLLVFGAQPYFKLWSSL